VVKHLKATSSKTKALTMLDKLERVARELVAIQKQMVELTEEIEKNI